MSTSIKSFKEIAQDFLRLVTTGKISEAFHLYIGQEFRHHNIYFKGDRQSLMKAMEENHQQYPNKISDSKHALQDGDLVAVHSHVRMNADDHLGMALVHIFRFEKNKIIELWDLGQPVPKDTVNENGMF